MRVTQDTILFKDRRDAGRMLGKVLLPYKKTKPVVMAIPRGGVVVGYEVARILAAPLDIIATRKIGAPGNPEFAIGAISEGNVQVLDEEIISEFGIASSKLGRLLRNEKEELQRGESAYRHGKTHPDLQGRTVILVDDGMATGYTALAAITFLHKLNPEKIVLAVPVAEKTALQELKKKAPLNDAVYISELLFGSVSVSYETFAQVNDSEVLKLLESAQQFLPENIR